MFRLLRIVSVLALPLLGSCSDDDLAELPSECVYSADYGCYSCNDTFGEDYQIGCRAVGDCEVFCGLLPAGYSRCNTQDPNHWCHGFRVPRGTLVVCTIGPNLGPPYYLPSIRCPPFCVGLNPIMVTQFLRDEGGDCYVMQRGCAPNDASYISSLEVGPEVCKNYDPPTTDAGVSDAPMGVDTGPTPDF
ncbi:MAG: hypothetical protein JRH20_32450 [Deltaproteobacteria bacterium]|nr:hypothetical protein [Deltaproteobacteria bacterium]